MALAPGPFDFAQGRLANSPVPTTIIGNEGIFYRDVTGRHLKGCLSPAICE